MSWDECMCGQECQKPCIFMVLTKETKRKELYVDRLAILAGKCAETHAPKDILEHLEEELLEVLTAIKAWKRGRGTVAEVIEECCDVRTEITTFFKLLENEGYITKSFVPNMETKKLDKFKAMLDKEQACYTLPVPDVREPISRYCDPVEMFLESRPKEWNR